MLNACNKLKLIGSYKQNPESFLAKNFYLCIHPGDRETYLNEIADIFNAFGDRIFIWAHRDADMKLTEAEKEPFLEDISKHCVFVAVITGNFFKDNDLCLWELKKAKSMGMKILPLILEETPALSNQLNMITGKIQALYPFREDPTEIPFMDKLSRYLEDIIICNTDLADKIRNVFSGRIFVSYRKKDRAYIAPLMEAIHSNPALDNIAVWYDESMRAGEDFEEQIWDAFAHADMGIMLLTRHSLEEGNYVAEKEYPFICERDIPFIPIIADGTDAGLVSDFFIKEAEKNNKTVKPLPDALLLSDASGIAQMVYDILSSLNVIKTELSREEKYYLGVAYETHTLTPQNMETALKYLTRSAAEGCMDAFERIVNIHEYGIGKEKDLDAAIIALNNYVKCLDAYAGKTDYSYYENFFGAVSRMVGLYREAGYEDEIDACHYLVEFSLQRSLENPGSLWQYRLLYAEKRFAKTLRDYKEFTAAENIYSRILQQYESICDDLMQKGIAVVGNYGITKPEEAFGGYTECLRGIGECRFLAAKNIEAVNAAIKMVQNAIRVKENLWHRYALDWAGENLYIEYQMLARMLLTYEMYQEAKNVLDADYEILEQLSREGRAKAEHYEAGAKNLIYTGDIAKELNPSAAQNYYQMAKINIDYLKANGYGNENLENMLGKRVKY